MTHIMPDSIYFDINHRRVFNNCMMKMEDVKDYESLIKGSLNGTEIVIHRNLSIQFLEVITDKHLSETLKIIEEVVQKEIKGFRYKMPDNTVMYRISEVLKSHNVEHNQSLLNDIYKVFKR